MLCYNVESKMLAKLIEVVVKDYQFYKKCAPGSPICLKMKWRRFETKRKIIYKLVAIKQ
jgi:hypothetical protein